MSTGLVRQAVIPRLSVLLQAHPLLELAISSSERQVDLLRGGFDCVLRGGPVLNASLADLRIHAGLPVQSPDFYFFFVLPFSLVRPCGLSF